MWLEPLGAKRARDGGFSNAFHRKGFYVYAAVFFLIFIGLWLIGDAEPDSMRPPFSDVFLPLFLLAVAVSFLITLILWAAPATIIMDEEGITYKMGEGSSTDRWEDISEFRIEQVPGWRVLAYRVRGSGLRKWGISEKVSAQDLLDFSERKSQAGEHQNK